MLTYRETICHSGNSIVQVVVLSQSYSVDDIREVFNALGCQSEKLHERYSVLEIPAAKNYLPIKEKLSELRYESVIDYAEPNLAEQHWY
jgi:hypothetical protein